MSMMSRSGKNTITSHFEFFKANQKEKENKNGDTNAIKSKIQTGKIDKNNRNDKFVPSKTTEGMLKTIEMNV